MESSLKAYHGRRRENIARGLELLIHFQISLGFELSVASLLWLLSVLCPFALCCFLVWFKYAYAHCICPRQTLTLKPLMSI